jgi:hypothetical protein
VEPRARPRPARGDEGCGHARSAADAPPWALVVAAAPVHLGVSLLWTSVLARTLPSRHRVAWGAAGGLAIAALDLGVIGRRYPAIRRLPLVPQLADHALFGAVVAVLTPR